MSKQARNDQESLEIMQRTRVSAESHHWVFEVDWQAFGELKATQVPVVVRIISARPSLLWIAQNGGNTYWILQWHADGHLDSSSVGL